MSKLHNIAPKGVVCDLYYKSSGPTTVPHGTPYESVTLSGRASLIYCGLVPIFK